MISVLEPSILKSKSSSPVTQGFSSKLSHHPSDKSSKLYPKKQPVYLKLKHISNMAALEA